MLEYAGVTINTSIIVNYVFSYLNLILISFCTVGRPCCADSTGIRKHDAWSGKAGMCGQ